MMFQKKVLFLGYGSVAQCTLPIFVRHLKAPWSNITVLEFEDRAEALAPWMAQGLRFVRERVTPENLDALLGRYLSPGDLLIDLAWNIDCREIVQWCHDRGVLYINTSVEVWDPYAYETSHPTERTLYYRHMQLRRLRECWAAAGTAPGPTAVVEHGANPGLISHFTRQGLVDIAQRLIADGRVSPGEADELRQ
jgi:homospermidine synthase